MANIPNNQIHYTSSDGQIVNPYSSSVFGTTIDTNVYENGVGIITFKGNVTKIDLRAFWNCNKLTSVTIPDSVTSIGEGAFEGCTSLTSINIPDSVTSIGDNAFSYCTSLTSINIPNSVISIGGYAFSSCSGLTSVTIGNSVTSIGNRAFGICSGLTSIVVSEGNTVYDSRNNCNAIIETLTNTLIAGCKNTIIPNSVTSIGDSAFYGCTGLTSINIQDSVTSIGGYAFSSCSGLTSVTIPNSVTSIGVSTFQNCSGLTSINIPDSVTSIGGYAFSSCSGLTSVTIGNSVTSIGVSSFQNCRGLTSITIPNSVTSIEEQAFYICSGLTTVTIGNSMTSIGRQVFFGCTNLTHIICMPQTPPTLNGGALPNTTKIFVPRESLETYKSNLSSYSERIFPITFVRMRKPNPTKKTSRIPNNEIHYLNVFGQSIAPNDNETFDACFDATFVESRFDWENNVGIITFNGNVTSIGDYAFDAYTVEAPDLTSITIPGSVTSIGEAIFSGNDEKLTSITLLSTTPPTIKNSTLPTREDYIIYVPAESVEAYKAAQYWSDKASQIQPTIII